jgi:hypothetical protein
MRVRPTVPLLIASLLTVACGGGSPSSPTPSPSDSGPSGSSYRGATVSALDGTPIPGVVVKVGTRAAVSDQLGRFALPELPDGPTTVTLSGSSVVDRRQTVALPADSITETLIPSSFDLAAFDEMFRGTGQLQRWTSRPSLVILASVMRFHAVGAKEFQASSERMSDEDIALLIEHLGEGLALLTGNTFTSFATVEIERPAAGTRIDSLRPGTIVVGRYKGVQNIGNTVGAARWSNDHDTPEVTGGAIYLDSDFDRTSAARRLLRIHELGHALGYLHVTSRVSIMNPSIGPSPTQFDRDGAIIAFRRLPGNQSPDDDVAAATPLWPGGVFGVRGLAKATWAPTVICFPHENSGR